MRIVCPQTILMKYYTLFFQKLGNTSPTFVVCRSRYLSFKGWCIIELSIITRSAMLQHFVALFS